MVLRGKVTGKITQSVIIPHDVRRKHLLCRIPSFYFPQDHVVPSASFQNVQLSLRTLHFSPQAPDPKTPPPTQST
ncbi:uncharacterized, partial [Tachysurus ichikawai]